MTTSSSLLNLFFLLLTFTIQLKFSIAAYSVKDTDGNALKTTSKYLILPFMKSDGGVTIARTGLKNELVVVLSSSVLPVTFTKSNTTQVILVDDIVSVNFITSPKYNGSSSWIVVDDTMPYLGVGSAEDYPGHQIKTGTFRIWSVGGGMYSFLFCSDIRKTPCGDVGVYRDSSGLQRLTLIGDEFLIKFKEYSI